jgi:hypothetical protein
MKLKFPVELRGQFFEGTAYIPEDIDGDYEVEIPIKDIAEDEMQTVIGQFQVHRSLILNRYATDIIPKPIKGGACEK